MKKLNLKGQSLIEVVLALAIISTGILALVKISTKSLNNLTFASNRAKATKSAQESIEEARILRDTISETTFFSLTYVSTTCTITETIGIFTRVRTCTLSADSKTVTAVVEVFWPDTLNGVAITHKSRLQTDLTKWK